MLKNLFRGMAVAATAAGAIGLGAVSPAKAAPTLTYTISVFDNTNTLVGTAATAVVDLNTNSITAQTGGFSLDGFSSPGDSILNFTSTVGGLQISSFSQATTNSPGSSIVGYLGTAFNQITNISGADRTFVLSATATDFTAPLSPPDLEFKNSASIQVTTGTFTGGTFKSTAAGQNGPTITLGSISGGSSFSTNESAIMNITTSPYTMTAEFSGTITDGTKLHDGGGVANLSPVPEPATLGMACTAAFAGLFYGVRRTRRSSKDAANRLAA